MSTRSQILFKFSDGQVLTYRHSDGYPSGVIPDLVDFLKWNKGRNNQYDYVIANYFYWSKKHFEHYIEDKDSFWNKGLSVAERKKPIQERKLGGNEPVLIGYGLDYDGRLHGDIDWFYVVEFIENQDSGISFKIWVYEPEYDETKDYEPKYKYPDLLIRNCMPKTIITIDDIDKYVYDESELAVIKNN